MSRSYLHVLLFLPLVLLPELAVAQHDGLLLINDPLQRFLERQKTAGHLPSAHLTHRPLSAYEAQQYLDSLDARRDRLSSTSRIQLDRFRRVAAGPGTETAQRFIPGLYANGYDFFSVRGEDYALQVNPLLYMRYGRGRASGEEATVPFWRNTRGAKVAGKVGPIFFDARLEENQRRDIWPVGDPWKEFEASRRTAPRMASTKYDTRTHVFDYFHATGMVGFRSPHFEVRFGREQNFWGPGRSSLFLSNYAPVYDQLQIRTSFWRIQYTNLFTQLADPIGYSRSFVPHKYGAFHRLAFDLPADFEVELFESVIIHPDTTDPRRARFDFDPIYLNPIIFYRAVEHDRGSPDNMTLGAGASWNGLPGLQLYTQFLLTELVVDAIGSGSWLNKWGWLAGAHLVDVPLDDLSLRLEFARIRPYVYQHRSPATAYTHYNDVLGHPIGPNARDVAIFADYRPIPELHFSFNASYTQRGREPEDVVLGTDPLKNYDDRATDEAPMLHGIRRNEWLVEARAGYEFLQNLFLEGALRAESFDDDELGRQRYAVPYVLLRWGLPYQSRKY